MRMRDKSKTGPNPASPPPSHTIEAAEVVERLRGWRRKLQEVGGYENGLVGIPAEGVRKTIDDCEQAADLLEHQAAEIARLREGWQEATIAWAVCASIHREYAKKRDPFFTTRQSDFTKAEAKARATLAETTKKCKS